MGGPPHRRLVSAEEADAMCDVLHDRMADRVFESPEGRGVEQSRAAVRDWRLLRDIGPECPWTRPAELRMTPEELVPTLVDLRRHAAELLAGTGSDAQTGMEWPPERVELVRDACDRVLAEAGYAEEEGHEQARA
jgi:hypothetical protein